MKIPLSEIGAKLFAGDFNGIPRVDDNNLVVSIVTAIDVLKAIQKCKDLYKHRAKDIMTPITRSSKKRHIKDEMIDIMIEKGIIMVPLVKDNTNKISGIVTGLVLIVES